jgi:GntR family transcriptional regulator
MTARFTKPDRSSPLPLWAQVIADVRRRLTNGEFTDGFPPERELIAQYEVSRHTMRDAMRRLHDEGLIDRERGRGTFLRATSIEQQAGSLYSLFQTVEDQGFDQRSEVLTLDERTSPEIADRLKLTTGTKFVYLQRLRNANSTPIATDEVWIPAAIGRPLLKANFEHTALYTELERLCRVRPEEGWERIHPVLPNEHERRLLARPRNEPAFLVERFTKHGAKPLEWRRTVIRGDHYTFVTKWGTDRSQQRASFTPSKTNATY